MVGLKLLSGHLPLVTAEEMMRKEGRKGCGVECGEYDVHSGEE